MAGGTRDADTVQTLNANEGVVGVRIKAERYDAMKRALLKAIPRTKSGIPFGSLSEEVAKHLPSGKLPGGGSITWYVTVVKLDLEARGFIERIEGMKPQRVRRISASRR